MRLTTAIVIVGLAALAFWADRVWFDQEGIAFLGKTLISIINWLAFWR